MYGFMGTILRVDLGSGKYERQDLAPELTRAFLGGRGLATRLYYDQVPPQTDPLAPENKVVICTGPLVGSGALSCASCYVVSKSPLTGTIACAKTRGHFGAELKFAGYDGLILEGKADGPVVLCLMDGKVFLKPVPHLWGRTTIESERLFKEGLDDRWAGRETYLATIGPAAERQLPISTVTNEGFLSVGGAGIGAIWGAKNLKGIAVKGQQSVMVADGDRLVKAVTTMINKLNGATYTGQLLPQGGTAFFVETCNQKGVLPLKNFSEPAVGHARRLGTQAIASAFAMHSRGCFNCPIACLKKTNLQNPRFKGRGVAPTYMAVGSLGTNLGITDLEAIGRANMICAEMGMDPIATGGLFATAMEMVEKGVVSAEDLKLDIAFENGEGLVKAMELVATKKGHAARLGQGGKALAEQYGAPELFMGVKNAPLASFDPRAVQGLGLHFATCNQGPHHTFAYTFLDELLQVHQDLDPTTVEGKPELVKDYQDMAAAMDSLGFCNWVLMGLKFGNLLPMTNAALGTDYKAADLMEIGERIWNLERLFNLKAGLSGADDALPARFSNEPMPSGPLQGELSRLDEMLPTYYRIRGWSKQGVPQDETLGRLGLEAC